ncbi:hypothetical protein GT360_17855 [Vibrio astriarenae]|uniref:Histidine kinase n=1 Tax=Vibrio astriarenae TaxID=1481923 RepID=A0A7Z2YFR5_9VIBR|nr:hypothetical protein [Vibrio astriarenae]QIA65405.1 hypothetical protein GT360_17855 [Vibrio astriarenae]
MVNRDKKDKFVELAEKRVTRAIKDLQLIGNLSNKNNYAYTPEDVDKIIKVLEGELRELKAKFRAGMKSDRAHFSLKD